MAFDLNGSLKKAHVHPDHFLKVLNLTTGPGGC